MNIRTATAATILTAGLISAGLATAPAALACGDTPGFCPNPPELAATVTCHESGNVNDCLAVAPHG